MRVEVKVVDRDADARDLGQSGAARSRAQKRLQLFRCAILGLATGGDPLPWAGSQMLRWGTPMAGVLLFYFMPVALLALMIAAGRFAATTSGN